MSEITRPGVEKLKIHNCPCCGGDVFVRECGYSTFNPGKAKCQGDCGREWKLGCVDDEWHAGQTWNKRAADIKRKLKAFQLLRVDSKFSISRDFARQEMEYEANVLLCQLREQVIGSHKEESSIHD